VKFDSRFLGGKSPFCSGFEFVACALPLLYGLLQLFLFVAAESPDRPLSGPKAHFRERSTLSNFAADV
jgi:hypothetical protein